MVEWKLLWCISIVSLLYLVFDQPCLLTYTKKTYDITIMYIDEEGQIYGQPVVWQKKLKQMERQLTEYHSKIEL